MQTVLRLDTRTHEQTHITLEQAVGEINAARPYRSAEALTHWLTVERDVLGVGPVLYVLDDEGGTV